MIPLNVGIPPALAQRFGLLNRGAGLTFGLSPQVVATIDWSGASTDSDVNERFAFWGWATQPNVAAQNPHIQLFNPAGSKKVIYLDAWSATKTTGGEIQIYQNFAGLSVLARTGFSTRFEAQLTPSAAQMRTLSAAGVVVASQQVGRHVTLGVTDYVLRRPPSPVRLDPGMGIFWWGPTVNEVLSIDVFFREYPEELVAE